MAMMRANAIQEWILGIAEGVGDIEQDADRGESDGQDRPISDGVADRRADALDLQLSEGPSRFVNVVWSANFSGDPCWISSIRIRIDFCRHRPELVWTVAPE